MLQQLEEFCGDTLTQPRLQRFSPFLLDQLAESVDANRKQLALNRQPTTECRLLFFPASDNRLQFF